MIAFIDGVMSEKRPNELVIDTQGVGWSLNCSAQTISSSPPIGSRAKIYTRMIVREDALDLYGFASHDERTLFDKLCTVTGIGPRTALSILGSLSVTDLYLALSTSDTTTLSRAQGVGKKTAQRIILELRDKLPQPEGLPGYIPAAPNGNNAAREAVSGLMSLGYSPSEAQQAVDRALTARKDADTPGGKTEDIIMDALKRIR